LLTGENRRASPAQPSSPAKPSQLVEDHHHQIRPDGRLPPSSSSRSHHGVGLSILPQSTVPASTTPPTSFLHAMIRYWVLVLPQKAPTPPSSSSRPSHLSSLSGYLLVLGGR
jgi:hypothetical protein